MAINWEELFVSDANDMLCMYLYIPRLIVHVVMLAPPLLSAVLMLLA